MRVLYLYAHPLAESFHAAIRDEIRAGLREAGHQVDLCDLYAEGFDPVLSAAERRGYHDLPSNRIPCEDYIRRVEAAEALVLSYPTWSFGLPADPEGLLRSRLRPRRVLRAAGWRGAAEPDADPQDRRHQHLMGGRGGMPSGFCDPPRMAVTRYIPRADGLAGARAVPRALRHEPRDLNRRKRVPRKVRRENGAGSEGKCEALPRAPPGAGAGPRTPASISARRNSHANSASRAAGAGGQVESARAVLRQRSGVHQPGAVNFAAQPCSSAGVACPE